MKVSGKIISILKQSVIVVIVVSVFAVIFNFLSPARIPVITPFKTINVSDNLTKIPVFQTRKQTQSLNLEKDFHSPDEINLEITYKYFRNHTAIFIDTRSIEDYRKGHISRAVSIPMESLDFTKEILPGLSRNEKIITYCDGEDCFQSIDLAVILAEIGFNDVYFFFGGWSEWQNAGYPTSIGDMP